MLRALVAGTPDFTYMEQTMRVIEYKIFSEYLKRVEV